MLRKIVDSVVHPAGFTALALMLRLLAGLYFGIDSAPDRAACGADTVEFEQGAWGLASGDGFVTHAGHEPTAFRAPGYPLFLSVLYRCAGRKYWVNRIALSVVGSVTCYLIYLCGLQLGLGRRAAGAAGLLTAILPLQIYYCGHFMSEPLAAMLNTGTVLFLVMGLNRVGVGNVGRRAKSVEGEDAGAQTKEKLILAILLFFVAGAINGASALVRPASVLMIPALGGLLAIAMWRRLFLVMIIAVVFASGSATVIAPWTVRNHRVLDRFCLVTSNGGSTFWGSNNALTSEWGGEYWGRWITTNFDRETKKREVLCYSNEVDRDRAEWRLGKQYAMENPGKWFSLIVGKVYRLVTPFPSSPNKAFVALSALDWLLVMGLSLGGFVILARKREWGVTWLPVLAQFSVLLASAMIFYGSER